MYVCISILCIHTFFNVVFLYLTDDFVLLVLLSHLNSSASTDGVHIHGLQALRVQGMKSSTLMHQNTPGH